MVAREEGHIGGVGAEQLPRASASETESSTCASTRTATCRATASRTPRRPRRGSEAHRTADAAAQDPGAVSYRRCLCEAYIRVSRNGTVEWHRGAVEEDSGRIPRDDTDGLATVEHGGGEDAAPGSPCWKETGSTSARGLQACGSETTRKATRSDGYETSACADCCHQAQWCRSRPVGSGSCCKVLLYSFYNTKLTRFHQLAKRAQRLAENE